MDRSCHAQRYQLQEAGNWAYSSICTVLERSQPLQDSRQGKLDSEEPGSVGVQILRYTVAARGCSMTGRILALCDGQNVREILDARPRTGAEETLKL